LRLHLLLLQVKVCDFNLSRMVAQQQQLTNSGNPNSPGWQSPEMLAGQPYGKAADVFSFGVVLWEVLTLKEPWR
jgi:serine/threonine protein kinase